MSSNVQPRLLMVDDDPANLLLLRRLFSTGNYHTTCLQSGEEALDALAHTAFDVVLLDIMMPNITGIDVLGVIRNTPETISLPVILVSALSDSLDIAQGLALGANDYVTKPIDVNVVVARVNTQIMLKRLLDERNQTIQNLRDAQAMRERFFRIATHDLKNPLNNIQLAHSLLRSYIKADDSAKLIFDTLGDSLVKMNEVIRDFLDTALLQSGKLDLRLDCVPADKLIWDVVTQFSAVAERKNITLKVASAAGMIYCDFARMTQVLGNLVSNAIKYAPKNTLVTIWGDERDGQVMLCVADQGPGIPPSERDNLFKEFSKLSTRPTANESSTGLGLWIVKHLATLHNGEVGVDCPPEGGSVFWVTLPTCPAN